MSAPLVAFFSTRAGVGCTRLVYHLAWMFAELGKRVLAADLDPQAQLTQALVDEDRLAPLWPERGGRDTVLGAVRRAMDAVPGGATHQVESVAEGLGVLAGDPELATIEDELADAWSARVDSAARALRCTSCFRRVLQRAAADEGADLVLMDLAPCADALTRAALLAADFLVVPLRPDVGALRGLHALGVCLRRWRTQWETCVGRPASALQPGPAPVEPVGYVLMESTLRLDRPTWRHHRCLVRFPQAFRQAVAVGPPTPPGAEASGMTPEDDPLCLGRVRPYPDLMSLAREARKPVFRLKAVDGAIGALAKATHMAHREFLDVGRALAHSISLGVT